MHLEKLAKQFPELLTSLVAFYLIALSNQTCGSHGVAQPGDEFFERYRPRFHFIARKGWQNDATGPFYDPVTDTYHMFYQLNPFNAFWGNMTWGHATSKDQVIWEDLPDALKPDSQWDHEGVFSGVTVLDAIGGLPTIFYTGATFLPINALLPYLGQPEHVCYATSSDNGFTWTKGAEPLIKAAPSGLDVTGWRDPYLFRSMRLNDWISAHAQNDKINNNSSSSSSYIYLIVAGGERNEGGRVFLYRSRDYHDWSFQGFLFAANGNYSSFSPLSSNFGYNFEMTQYVELPDPVSGQLHSILIVGIEGNRGAGSRKSGHTLWMICQMAANRSSEVSTGSILEPLAVGIMDYGLWKGNNAYLDKDGRQVVIAWTTEDIGPNVDRHNPNPQGWSGMLSLPRELGISVVENVYDPENRFDNKGPWLAEESGLRGKYHSKRLRFTSIRPIEGTKNLRETTGHSVAVVSFHKDQLQMDLPQRSRSFELYVEVERLPKNSQFGIQIRSSRDGHQYTRIYYDDKAEEIRLDKSHNTELTCLPDAPDLTDDSGFFKLLDLIGPISPGEKNSDNSTNDSPDGRYELQTETLRLRVFVDVSIIEIYANDRFAMTSRIYPCGEDTDGISAYVSEPGATVKRLELWSRMLPAWPSRLRKDTSPESTSAAESVTVMGPTSQWIVFGVSTVLSCLLVLL